MVIAEVENEELVEYAKNEIVKMDERNAKRKSAPSKKAEENEPIKKAIAEFLADKTEPTTAKEIGEGVEISTQKASALCRQMVEDGRLTSTEIKVKGKGKQKGYKVA